MQFALPAGDHFILQPAPIHHGHKAAPLAAPFGVAVGRVHGLVRIFIDPMLEGIHHGHVGPEEDVAFKVLDARAFGLGGGVESTGLFGQVGRGQQFHAHRGHLGELHRHVQLLGIAQRGIFEDVEGMPALVQQGLHVVVDADRVHEDERAARHREAGAVAAGGLVLAVDQVEQVFAAHGVEIAAQHGIDMVKDRADAGLEFIIVLEGTQRGLAGGVHVQVPRAQRIEAQALAAAFVHAPRGRHDGLFDGFVEFVAVVGGVIKALQVLPHKGAVIGLAGVGGHFAAQRQELLPQLVERAAVGELPLGGQPPGLLAPGAVGRLEDRLELLHGDFLAFPFDHLRAGDFLVLGDQLLLFAHQRQVFLAEQVGFGAHVAQRNLEPGRLQPAFQQHQLELVVGGHSPGKQVLEKGIVGFFGVFVGGVDRDGHRQAAARFGNGAHQVRPLVQPGGHVGRVQRGLFELGEVRLKVGPGEACEGFSRLRK